jgi:hypothetical protein
MSERQDRKRPESYYQEIVKRYLGKKYGCATVRELNFGGPKFDVVGFSPDTGEFHIVECKRTSRLVGIGQTFGQILAYKAMIFDSGEQFLNAYLKQLAKEGITRISFFSEVAQFANERKVPIRFYVALREKACLQPDFLRLMKRDLSGVGIIRINKYNQCREYIKVRGIEDYELCKADRIEVPISTPPRPIVQKVLEHQASSPDVVELTSALDSRILKMHHSIKSFVHGKYAVFYRVGSNFVGLNPKKQFVRISIREGNRWREVRVKRKSQLRTMTKRIRKALSRSLSD